jgi:hypothetical protein
MNATKASILFGPAALFLASSAIKVFLFPLWCFCVGAALLLWPEKAELVNRLYCDPSAEYSDSLDGDSTSPSSLRLRLAAASYWLEYGPLFMTIFVMASIFVMHYLSSVGVGLGCVVFARALSVAHMKSVAREAGGGCVNGMRLMFEGYKAFDIEGKEWDIDQLQD